MSATLQAVAQRAAARSVAERARRAVTLLNLHFAGVAVLGLLLVYMAAHMLFAYQKMRGADDAAAAQQMVALKAAELGAMPLQGLDAKLADANGAADAFYTRRLPYAESQVLAELGRLTATQHVKLSGVQYSQEPVLSGTPGELTELRMDARLSGDYRSLVLFINSLERDRMFFWINSIALSGQQSGTVNLRLRVTSYLRPRAAGDKLDGDRVQAGQDAGGPAE